MKILSTPHGKLGTLKALEYLHYFNELSTPHGKLGTEEWFRECVRVLKTFNSTR